MSVSLGGWPFLGTAPSDRRAEGIGAASGGKGDSCILLFFYMPILCNVEPCLGSAVMALEVTYGPFLGRLCNLSHDPAHICLGLQEICARFCFSWSRRALPL